MFIFSNVFHSGSMTECDKLYQDEVESLIVTQHYGNHCYCHYYPKCFVDDRPMYIIPQTESRKALGCHDVGFEGHHPVVSRLVRHWIVVCVHAPLVKIYHCWPPD